jgi:hypothetical protein
VDQEKTLTSKAKSFERYAIKLSANEFESWQVAIFEAEEALKIGNLASTWILFLTIVLNIFIIKIDQKKRINYFFGKEGAPGTQESTRDEIGRKRTAVMVLFDLDLTKLSLYTKMFKLEKKIVIGDYLGHEFYHSEIEILSKEATLKRFEKIRKSIELIYKNRRTSHPKSLNTWADLAVLRGVEAKINNFPMLEMDVIHRFVEVGLEAKEVVYERLYLLKKELFASRENLDKVIKIIDKFQLRLPTVSSNIRLMCSSEI